MKKKITINLAQNATAVLCAILADIRRVPPGSMPGLEVEFLLVHEFYEKHMSALHFPQPAVNKFILTESTALALVKNLSGYDMQHFGHLEQIERDDIVDRLSRQIAHLFSHNLIYQA